jgi:DNA-binding LytR/AlgR family response regulator
MKQIIMNNSLIINKLHHTYMKIRCLVVDDEPLAAELVATHITKLPDLQLIATCPNALEAFALLQKEQIDLLFLDINMPRMTGWELLKSLPEKPYVIITTAYREYALDGYEFDVLDFLLKPITFERFLKAVGKYQQRKAAATEASPSVADSYEQAYKYFKVNREMKKVFLKDILYIESLKDYVRIKTDKESLITYQRISYLEEKLPDDKFMRVHKSFIVAIDKIAALGSNNVKIRDKEIPIGRNYKMNVSKLMTT